MDVGAPTQRKREFLRSAGGSDSSQPSISTTSSRDGSPQLPGTAGPSSSSPSPGQPETNPISRRRQRETDDTDDLLMVAPRFAKRLHLTQKGEKQLEFFCKLSPEQRQAYAFAHALHLEEKISKIQPVDALYTPEPKLLHKIVIYAHQILLCPAISGYRAEATRMLIAVIERHPGWGYTSEIKEDNQKAKIVLTVVQNTLTHACSSIKGVLGRSFGDPDPNEPENDRLRVGCADIVQLTRDSIRTLDTNRLVVNKTRANLAMCTRFAFLRQEYRKPENEKDFWKGVDNELAALRNKYKADPESLNKYFTDVLTKDVKIYGDSPDSGEVVATEKHDQQREVEAFAERTESQLTNLGNEDGEDD